MPRSLPALFVLCALLCCPAVMSQHATAAKPILAQDLQQLRVPGKILAALWTRRDSHCTLQLVYPDPGRFFMGKTISELRGLDPTFGARTLTLVDGRRVAESLPASKSAVPPGPPSVQVWLLRANGTVIEPTPSKAPARSPAGTLAHEVLYSFPLFAAKEAVAAAIRVDGDFYIEQLQPFTE